MRSLADEVLVVSDAGQRTHRLPYPRERLRSLAISDTGDRVALLVAPVIASPEARASDGGSLEIWSLPCGSGPLATARLPLHGYALVAANAAVTRLSVYTSNSLNSAQYAAVYDLARGGGELTALWEEKGPPLSRIRATLGGDWAWAVEAAGLVGWRASEAPARLPGCLRDCLMFSPTFSHLLANRGEASVSVTSVKMLFRLFDLSTLVESRRVSHVIESYSDAHFALSGDLALYELRATRDAEIVAKDLGW